MKALLDEATASRIFPLIMRREADESIEAVPVGVTPGMTLRHRETGGYEIEAPARRLERVLASKAVL